MSVKFMQPKIIALLLLAMFAPLSHAMDLVVQDAWVREAPPTARTLAGYGLLSNHGDQEITVTAVSSKSFGRVEMHSMIMKNGMMQMKAVKRIVIPAGGTFEFVPGGYHLMLINPAKSLRDGDRVELEFELSNGAKRMAEFVVKKAASMMN
jgi:copper(I)-binding protein